MGIQKDINFLKKRMDVVDDQIQSIVEMVKIIDRRSTANQTVLQVLNELLKKSTHE